MAAGPRSRALVGWTIGISVLVALYQATAFYQGYELSRDFYQAWRCAFPFMLTFWVDEDSKGRAEVYRPSFDIGFFLYLAWFFYLPFYLLRTRGPQGWWWILGLFTLASLGTILQWAIYAAS